MEITVEREEHDTCTVTVSGKAITTTIGTSELRLKRWIRDVQVICGKRNRQTIVVGLCADGSLTYSNVPYKSKGIHEKFNFYYYVIYVSNKSNY